MKNANQEHPYTCRKSLIFLRFLRLQMDIMTVGIIFIQLDFAWGSQKHIILGMLCEKWLSGTSLYMEDVFDLLGVLEVPDGDHDSWSHLHSTGFCLGFPKMENTWGVMWKMSSGTTLYFEDILYLLGIPEVPDGDHDDWIHHHLTGFCLRIPKMYNTLDYNCILFCQEPLYAWRTSLIFLKFLSFLMRIMMVGLIFIQLDFAWGFQKCIILEELSE